MQDPRDRMLNIMDRPPEPRRMRPISDGLAITAFIMAWFFPPIGFILGCVSISESHKNNRDGSGLAGWAILLGAAFTLLYIIIIVLLVKAASTPATLPCDLNNPAYPYC